MAEFLTVKTMTDRLINKFPWEDPIKMSRSIQHWTNVRLLSTDSRTPLNRGSGRHRLYPLEQLYMAAIISELTPYSILVGKIRSILDIVEKEEERTGMLHKAAKGQKWIFSFGLIRFSEIVFGQAMEMREFKPGKPWEPMHMPLGDDEKLVEVWPYSVAMIRLDYLLYGL